METIKKECKVVMLPCKNSNKGIYKSACSEKLHYFDKRLENSSQSYHLYILSNDEINQGDWINYKDTIYQYTKSNNSKGYEIVNCMPEYKKIIASTDLSLNLPKPSQAFLKKYCEENGIYKVMVEYIIKYYSSGQNEKNWHECTKEGYERVEKDYWFDTKKEELIKTNSKNEISISACKTSWSEDEVCSIAFRAAIEFNKGNISTGEQLENYIKTLL